MRDFSKICTDYSPQTAGLVFISMLLYSYYRLPYKIMSAYYACYSLTFLLDIDIAAVNGLIAFPIAVWLGICIGEVVSEDVTARYFPLHLVGALLSLAPVDATWILFPVLFCASALVCGYKRMLAYAFPTLLIIGVITSQIAFAPLVALCSSVVMLLPFALVCPLFPKEIPFEMV